MLPDNYYSSDKVQKWVGYKTLERMKRGFCKGMDAIDVAAVCEGQAERKMRNYSSRKYIWEIES